MSHTVFCYLFGLFLTFIPFVYIFCCFFPSGFTFLTVSTTVSCVYVAFSITLKTPLFIFCFHSSIIFFLSCLICVFVFHLIFFNPAIHLFFPLFLSPFSNLHSFFLPLFLLACCYSYAHCSLPCPYALFTNSGHYLYSQAVFLYSFPVSTLLWVVSSAYCHLFFFVSSCILSCLPHSSTFQMFCSVSCLEATLIFF